MLEMVFCGMIFLKKKKHVLFVLFTVLIWKRFEMNDIGFYSLTMIRKVNFDLQLSHGMEKQLLLGFNYNTEFNLFFLNGTLCVRYGC